MTFHVNYVPRTKILPFKNKYEHRMGTNFLILFLIEIINLPLACLKSRQCLIIHVTNKMM